MKKLILSCFAMAMMFLAPVRSCMNLNYPDALPDAAAAEATSPANVSAAEAAVDAPVGNSDEARPESVTVRFLAGDPDAVGTVRPIVGPAGDSIVLPTGGFRLNNYIICGWSRTAGSTAAEYNLGAVMNLPTDGDVTLFAVWCENTVSVHFDLDGSTSFAASELTVERGSSVRLPEEMPEKEGYDFIAWVDENTGIRYSPKALLTLVSDILLVPVFEEHLYNVKFIEGTETYTREISHFDNLLQLDYPVTIPEGYTFKYWMNKSEDAAYTPGNVLEVTSDVCLHAVFEPVICRITFAAGGGSGSMDSISSEYDARVTLPECGFTRTGYRFAGWKLPGGETVKAGSSITVTGDIELMPVYDLVTKHTVHFLNPLSINGNNITLAYRYHTVSLDSYFDVSALARQGYNCRVTLEFDVSGKGRVKRTVVIASGNEKSGGFETELLRTNLGEKFTGHTTLDSNWFPASKLSNERVYIAVAASGSTFLDWVHNSWEMSGIIVNIEFSK